MQFPAIIIPVHNAFERLVECLESVNSTAPSARVVVIDDASTDSRVVRWLEQWEAGSPSRELLTNRRNLGFVKSVNRGMSETGGDVVLLNSDTVVTQGWLDALTRCMASDPAIATATPWSNNGEIVSLPEFCAPNPVPGDPDRVAQSVKQCKANGYPDLPTAVGFCMAISRRALEALGLFDAETFGRGYGEENDFSMRARAAGLRNVLCDDAYVVHHGGASFGPTGLRPGPESMQRLLHKHPGYMDLVAAFIDEDPLARRREAIGHALEGEVP